MFAVHAGAQDFSISTLTGNNAVVVDVNALVGDDRGGLAVSSSHVFLTGDAATARFNRDTLGGGTSLGVVRDGLVANLADSTIYFLGNGSTPLPSGGGTFNSLIELNGSTGAPSGAVINLSTPITLTGSSASVGIFSGWNRIVVHTGTRAYRVSLPSGTVTDLGAMGVPVRTASESWAYWGVAENVGSDTYLVYVRNNTTIFRTKVPSGPTTTVATFANLSDMASFTVSVAQNRWYFHHESSSQFGAFSESLGYADATFVSAPVAPTIAVQPVAVSVIAGEAVAFSVSANGTGPLAYQWLKNGSPIGGATTNSYAIGMTSLADAGSFSVVITNASGSVTSSVAALTVAAIDADLFKIIRLTASNAVVMDPILAAGDDRGGLVATDERIFLRGDDSVGSFDLGLSGGARLGTNNGASTNFFQYDSLVSDLRTQKAYVLADGAGSLGINGGTVTRLVEIHGSNGVPTGTVIALGIPIAMPGAGLYTANVGIFSGWGRIVLHNGSNAWSINTANGVVTDLGAMARPTRAASESWAYWGVAEYFGGSHYMVYARDAQSIVRTRIPDGVTTVISTFSNLNDLASFTVVPGLNRWYFHNETVNQFTNYANFGGEVLGYADAAFIFQAAGTLALATNSVVVLEDSGGHTPTGFVTSAPGGTASYALASDNAGLFAVAPSLTPAGILSFTPAANASGSANVTVSALNSGGLAVGSGSFIITVTAVNDAPGVALATNHVVVLEDSVSTASPGFAVFTFGPANESGQGVLAVTVTNDNNALFSVLPAISAAGTLTFTPAANAFGSATVTVIVQDNGGTLNGGVNTSASQNLTITVSAVNDAPVVAFSTNNVVVLEDSGSTSVSGFANFSPGPANEAAQTLMGYTVANDNGALFSVPPVIAADGTLAFTPAPNANGSATMTVIAQDNGGTANGGVDRSTNTFTLTVTAVNDAPGVVFATNNVVVLEDGGAASVSGFATFSSGQANESSQSITNVVTSSSNPALFSVLPALALDGTLTFTPATNASGSATVTVTAQDNGGTASGGVNAVTNVFTISVVPVNDRPVIAVAGNVTVLEDSGAVTSNAFVTVTSLGAADETGQAITNYAVSSTNAALFSVPPAVDAAGTLTFTPAPNASGTALVTVTAQDNGGTLNGGQDTSVEVQFLITVLAVNDQPSIAFTTNNVFVLEDSGAASVSGFANFTLSPANESGQAVTNVAASNDNSALFAVQPVVGTNGSLTFTPAANANGSATVTVIAQDDGGTANAGVDRATNSFTITVTAVNDAPGVTFGTNNVVVLEDGGAVSMGGFASFSPGPVNEASQTLVGYTVANNNTALFSVPPALAPDGMLTLTPAANVAGSATMTVIAQDSGGIANGGVDKVTNSFTITVTAVNDAPTIVLGTNNVVVLEDGGAQTNLAFATFLAGPANESGQTITNLTILAVTNSALFVAGPVIGNDGTLVFTPAANANGTALVTFVVQDSGGTANGGTDTSASALFLITVLPVNDAPSITFITNTVVVLEDSGTTGIAGFASFSPGPVDEAEQGITNVTVSASDPALFSIPPALGTNGTLTFAPALNINGTATVTMIAQDNGGTANGGMDRSTNTFTITVTSVNDAPGVTFTTNSVTVLEDSGPVSQAAFASFSTGPAGESGQSVTNVAVNVGNPALFSAQPVVGLNGTLTFTPAADASGSAIVTVVVQDSGGTADGGVDKATNSFTITILPVNDAPAIAFLTNNLAVLEDCGATSLGGFAVFATGPANESGQALASVITSNDNSALFAVQPVVSINGTLAFTPATNANGTATVTVVALDDGGATNDGVDRATNTFTITVTPVNDAPVITLATNLVTVLEDTGAVLPGFASATPGPANEAGQTLTGYNVMTDNLALFDGLPEVHVSGRLYFATATNASGTATVSVAVFDSGGTLNGGAQNTTNIFTVVVVPVNDPPVVTFSSNNLTVLEDSEAASFTGFAVFASGPADESGQRITNVTVSASDPALFSVPPSLGTNGTLTFTPAANASGFATVTVVVQDDGGTANGGLDRTTNTFTINIGAVNAPPVLLFGTNNVIVLEDSGAASLATFATLSPGPANEAGQSVTNVMVSSDNLALFSVLPSLALDGTLTFTPATNVNGTSTVTVIAQDNGGTANGGVDRTTNSFTITVIAVNDAPGVTFSTNTIVVLEDNGEASLSSFAAFTPGFANESGQVVTNVATSNDNGPLFLVPPVVSAAGTLTFTPASNASGTALVTVIVQDNGGTANGGVDRVTDTFTITVTPVNDAPGFMLANLAFPTVVAWGYNGSGGTNVPAGLNGVTAIDGGAEHTLAVLANGTVMGWGLNASNQATPPVGLSGVTSVAAGTYHSLALKSDGTVVAWGSNYRGQSAVPVGLTGVVAISAGGDHSVALKADGTVVTWGSNLYGESTVPAGLTNVIVIAAGETHTAALKSDGTIVVWGYGDNGEKNLPVGLTNIVTIASGGHHLLALRSNGTVVAWGYNSVGQATVPAGLSNVVAVSGGLGHSSVLKSDGTVVVFGANNVGQKNVPAGLAGVVMIASGSAHTLAVTGSLGVQLTVAEDSGPYTQAGFATNIVAGPADESAQAVTFLVSNNNNSLFSTPPAIGADGTLTFTSAGNASGLASVTVRAQDNGGTANGGVDTSASQTFTITVSPVSDAPVVSLATNHVVVLEDSGSSSPAGFAAFSPGPADEAGQTLVSYTVTTDNPAIFSVQPAISTSGTLTFTPGTNAFEGAVVTVIAQDSGGTASGGINRTTNVFAISVLPVNDPPQVVLTTNVVLVPLDSGAFSNGAFAAFSAGPANELGQSITNVTVLGVSAPSLFDVPPALTTAGTLTFTLAAGASGSATVSFVAQDNGGTSNGGVDRATNSFTIAVAAPNTAPVVTFSTNLVAVLEDSGAVSRPGFASFSPGPVGEAGQLLLGYTVASDNAALFSIPPALNTAGTLTFTPATNANGSATVTVIAQDNGGTDNGGVDRMTNTFTITVAAVNDAPGFTPELPPAQVPDNSIIAWGYGAYGQTTVPAGLTNAVAISVGNFHSLAVRFDGTVVAWGYNGSGQVNVPAGLSNVVAVAAGGFHSLALRSDGTVFGWGSTALPAGLTNDITSIAAGGYFSGSAAARSDGRVVAWGIGSLNGIVAGISNAVGVAAAERFGLALLSDGTVVGFGSAPAIPVGLGNVIAVAAGSDHALALRSDGTVVGWGTSSYGALPVPPGLSNVIAISAGGFANVALRADGSVVSWGTNPYGQTNVPAGLSNVIAVATGGFSQLALRRNNWVGDVTVAEDSGPYALPGFATNIVAGPANESGQTVAFLVAHDNASLFSVPPALSPDGTLTFTSATNANGIATVTIRLQDDGGTANGGVDTSSAQTFTIAIAMVNDPPVVTFSSNQVVVLEDSGSASVAGFASFSGGPANESAQTLAGYALTNDSPALFSIQPALGTNGTLTFTPATNAVGTATVTVVAQDSGGTNGGGLDRATNTFILTVAPVNDPPRVTFVTDPAVALPDGGPTNFPGFATFAGGPADESGQAVTVVSVVNDNLALFTAGGQPALSGTGELAFEPAAGAAGSALVTVVFEDDGGTANGGLNRATNSFTIMVTATRVFIGPLADTVPNGTLTVPVRLAGTGVEGGIAFTLNYNPGLFSFGSVALGGGAAGATLLTNTSQSAFYGRLGVLVMLPAGTTFPAGESEVAVVTLNVSASAPATDAPLTFGDAPVRREVTDVSAVPLTNVAFQGRSVRVLAALPALEGDVSPRTTGNGLLTVSDVLQVGRFAAGLDAFPIFGGPAEFQRADCAPLATQGDGRVSLADWLQAARFAAGLDTPGTPGGPTTQAAALPAAMTNSASANRIVRVTGGDLVAGRTNSMIIQLDAQGNEAGVSLSLAFDPGALTYMNAVIVGSAGGALVVNSSKAAAGRLGLVFAMPAGASLTVGTHDLIKLTFVVAGGTTSTVINVGDSPVMREVADVNAIPLGTGYVNYVGTSFNIILPAELKAAGLERAADGSLRLVVRNSDGTPVSAAQAAKYQVHVTSNLGGAWTVLPNALIVENGALKVVDPSASSAGLRLYKLVETP